MSAAAQASRPDLLRALRDAGWTAIITFGLFLPLIGFVTYQDVNNQIALDTRFGLLAGFVAVVTIGRLAYALAIAPQLARAAARAAPAEPSAWRAAVAKWFTAFAIGFVIFYPGIVLATAGWDGATKWIDNLGIQILIYVMLGWGLNIVVGLAGLLDLGYVAFYAVGAYSYALLAE